MCTVTPLEEPQRWLSMWITQRFIFTPAVLRSVWITIGRELVNHCCGVNVASLCESSYSQRWIWTRSCVAILPSHTARQVHGSECHDFGLIRVSNVKCLCTLWQYPAHVLILITHLWWFCRCMDGFYGDPVSRKPCQPCLCPDVQNSGRFFATSCQHNPQLLSMDCNCREGHTGTSLPLFHPFMCRYALRWVPGSEFWYWKVTVEMFETLISFDLWEVNRCNCESVFRSSVFILQYSFIVPQTGKFVCHSS